MTAEALGRLIVKLQRAYAPAYNHGLVSVCLNPAEVELLLTCLHVNTPTVADSYKLADQSNDLGERRK